MIPKYALHLSISCLIWVLNSCLSQEADTNTFINLKNGISKPSLQTTHPFGILFSRLHHNFKKAPDKIFTLDIQSASGNIWGQPITAYIPSEESERQNLKDILFYSRVFFFDTENSPSETYQFSYDGVVKEYRISGNLAIDKKQEMIFTLRSFLLTGGKFPWSLFTSDTFIEEFHSNIAGGEDPFARRIFGFDKAEIKYTDRKGNNLDISQGEFVLSGIETAYYYYPELLSEKDIYLNFGAHLGANLTKYNSSIDLGISAAGIKEFNFSNNRRILFGVGLNLLRKKAITFNSKQADLGTSNYIGSFETEIEFTKRNQQGGHHSIGINYHIETPYNIKKEEDYYVPVNSNRIKRWHEAASHLYKFPSYWSLIYTFSKKTECSVYIQQDLEVNNAPDIQTGIRLKIPLKF